MATTQNTESTPEKKAEDLAESLLQEEAPPLLKLRQDLNFRYQHYGDDAYYLIEDPVDGEFYQIGLTEYALLRKLDGATTLDDIAASSAHEFNPLEVKLLGSWLVQSRLAYMQDPDSKSWHLAPNTAEKRQRMMRLLNPIFIRLPLGSPDRLLDAALPWFRWMLGWPFFLLWLLIVITGAYQIAANADAFAESANSLLSVHNILWMAIAWTLIKTIHELFHGLVCKKYGGYIHEAGVFLILFTPLGGFVNASSAWRFSSKWQRIHVSVAGMFIELLLAGIGAWLWAYSEPGPLNYIAYNMIVIAGIGTLAFNANPLMRFDGYYVLADILDIPNLYTSGQKYIRYLGKHYIGGRDTVFPPAGPKAGFVKVYGIAAFLWRIMIMLSIILMASLISQGVGVVMASVGLFFWIGMPFIMLILSLRKDPQSKFVIARLLSFLAVIGVLLALLLTQVEWSRHLSAPAVLDYADAEVVRAETPGFIRVLHVEIGEQVKSGQILAELENPELVMQRDNLRLEIERLEIKRQHYFKQNQLSEYQLEQEKITELQTKLRDLEGRVAALSLQAPRDGTVIADQELALLQDQYLRRGQELLTLGDPQQIEVRLSIGQDDIDYFRAHQGKLAEVYLERTPLKPVLAHLDKVKPAADRRIQSLALTAVGGGPLDVQPSRNESSPDQGRETGNGKAQTNAYEHLKPRFSGLIRLPTTLGRSLSAGERAEVVIATAPQTLGETIYRAGVAYLRRLSEAKTQATGNF